MGDSPPMSPVLPAGVLRPTRTARLLQPSIVLASVVILLMCGVMGMGIGISRFKELRTEPLPASVNACQGFMIVASGFSILYVFLHVPCAVCNEPIGNVRPPEKRIHAACFIVARLTMALWIACVISTAVVISRPGICAEATQECWLQVLDLIAADLCFLATGVILTALEACKYPFEIPEAFTTGVTCRVSDFGDDLHERSVSAASSFESRSARERRNTATGATEATEATEPPAEKPSSPKQTVPGEFPVERRLTPLLPLIPVSQATAWSDEWKYLVNGGAFERSNNGKADSAIDLGSEASSASADSSSDQGSDPPAPIRSAKRLRVVTPSSSISNESQRSPLSRMRSADFPDIIIQPELKFLPVSIPPPHGWTTSRAIPVSKLPKTVDPHKQQKPPTVRPQSPSTQPRRPGLFTAPSSPIIRKPVPTPIVRRRTIDIKVPGAFLDYRPSIEDERKLEEHARKIEVESVARTWNHERPRGMPTASNPLRDRYQAPSLNRPQATMGPRGRDGVQQPPRGKVENTQVKPLRRLSLVDVSPELGRIFD